MTQTAPYADTQPLASQRGRPSTVRLGSFPANSEQDLRFVQDRMALFGKVTFLISGMFWIATTAADLTGTAHRYSSMARLSHAFGTLLAFALWQLARRPRNLTPNQLQTIDIVTILGLCWSFTAMGHFAVQPYGFYTGMLAATHVSISRAMVVPSIPTRTFTLTVASFFGFLISRAMLDWPTEVTEVAGSQFRGVLEAFLWSTAGTAVATVASTVIYGLHEKALEARQLGQYSLEVKIGEGGMGEVYRARHAMLRRPTAVKLLSGDGSEEQLRRFEKEVQLTARLTHPNTISIYDYGRTPEGVFYYAMELLEGLTLEQLVERHGAQPPARVIHMLLQICGALKEAHNIGLIHRDIKPANLYLCRRGDIPDFIKVLDFGLVRDVKSEHNISRSNITAVVGTPLYLAPEAIVTPERIDARADIYGLGCVAYYLITGTPPFAGENLVELCAHHLHTPPPPPSSRRPVPVDLERAIMACLEKDRETRPQNAQALSEALIRCEDARGWSDRDAETWWAAAPPVCLPAVAAPLSGAQACRTICCADLSQRVARRPKSA